MRILICATRQTPCRKRVYPEDALTVHPTKPRASSSHKLYCPSHNLHAAPASLYRSTDFCYHRCASTLVPLTLRRPLAISLTGANTRLAPNKSNYSTTWQLQRTCLLSSRRSNIARRTTQTTHTPSCYINRLRPNSNPLAGNARFSLPFHLIIGLRTYEATWIAVLFSNAAVLRQSEILSERNTLVHPSVCLPVTLVMHAYTIQHIEMPCAPYDRAMLDACFLCSS